MGKLRLDRIISDSGQASRKDAVKLIKSGAVIVDGRVAKAGEEKVDPETAEIVISGVRLQYRRFHYLMMNKPAGYVSATEDTKEKTVLELLEGIYQRLELFPAGRLDKDAEGLLLLTDDGEWAHKVISPVKKVYKTYYVETENQVSPEDIAAFRDGVILKDGLHCLPAGLQILSAGEKNACLVTICEGKYHQVKRMLASLGKPVIYLRRLKIGALSLDENLGIGEYRELSESEAALVFSGTDNLITLSNKNEKTAR